MTRDPQTYTLLQSGVLVGGGPRGDERAGSLIHLLQSHLLLRAAPRDFKRLLRQDCRLPLDGPVDRVPPTREPSVSAATVAFGRLQGAGVELRLCLRVEDRAPGRLRLNGTAGPTELEAATI